MCCRIGLPVRVWILTAFLRGGTLYQGLWNRSTPAGRHALYAATITLEGTHFEFYVVGTSFTWNAWINGCWPVISADPQHVRCKMHLWVMNPPDLSWCDVCRSVCSSTCTHDIYLYMQVQFRSIEASLGEKVQSLSAKPYWQYLLPFSYMIYMHAWMTRSRGERFATI